MTPVEAWEAGVTCLLPDEGFDWLCAQLERGLKAMFAAMKEPVLMVREIVQVRSMSGVEEVATGRQMSINGFGEVSV